ncbi:hypothetical protein [Adonisia turfae]|nr:hypothetical protein [Adonisia turfae]
MKAHQLLSASMLLVATNGIISGPVFSQVEFSGDSGQPQHDSNIDFLNDSPFGQSDYPHNLFDDHVPIFIPQPDDSPAIDPDFIQDDDNYQFDDECTEKYGQQWYCRNGLK